MDREARYPIINREVSWLRFNERVLQEAMDEQNPLLERLRFLGIFSNNRDEFFRVRVAALRRLLLSDALDDDRLRKYGELMDEIMDIVSYQERIFTDVYYDIVQRLSEAGVHLVNEQELKKEQGDFVKSFFRDKLRAYLFPILLDNFSTPDSLKDGAIYLAVEMGRGDEEEHENYALVKVPVSRCGRFLELPSEDGVVEIILMDDVIRYCLPEVFAVMGYTYYRAYTIKVTRDAELDIDNDVSKSFLELMSASVKRRKRGVPVRFVYDASMSPVLYNRVLKKLKVKRRDYQRGGGRYHNFKDFMNFPFVGAPALWFEEMKPLLHPAIDPLSSMFTVIKQGDVMLHFPYHAFQHIIDLLREASIDPGVRSIKMTFYRAARYSNVINALVNAARNGKQVTVFLELQARFDEEANIILTKKLQDEGVTIIHAIPGLKVHSKMILIHRVEEGKSVYYTNISTGNFNESTARVYADDSLLTADDVIAQDVAKVFYMMENRYLRPRFKSLLVSPLFMRKEFMMLLNREMEISAQGGEGWVILKMNSLADKKLIRKLYDASCAGVKITLIVRGICMLMPGIKGVSENISAFSIVDRFLEHSRVYVFGNSGEALYYLSSADWMPRNISHRIEVAVPVLDKGLQHELDDILKLQMCDNVKARLLGGEKENSYRVGEASVRCRSQYLIYDYLKRKGINKNR